VAHLRPRRGPRQRARVVALGSLTGGGQLLEHLAALFGRQLRERLGVRLLDRLRRSRTDEVAVALDRLRVGIAGRRSARNVGAANAAPVIAEQTVEQAHVVTPSWLAGHRQA